MNAEVKQVIVIRKDLKMRQGKVAAQAGHAILSTFINHGGFNPATNEFHSLPFSPQAMEWFARPDSKKVVVYVNSEQELLDVFHKARSANILSTLITDNGKTEFHGVLTKTAVAIGPDYAYIIDPITGHLPLL